MKGFYGGVGEESGQQPVEGVHGFASCVFAPKCCRRLASRPGSWCRCYSSQLWPRLVRYFWLSEGMLWL